MFHTRIWAPIKLPEWVTAGKNPAIDHEVIDMEV